MAGCHVGRMRGAYPNCTTTLPKTKSAKRAVRTNAAQNKVLNTPTACTARAPPPWVSSLHPTSKPTTFCEVHSAGTLFCGRRLTFRF